MRPVLQPPPQTLSAWLDLATRNLVPSAQARVGAEIGTHFAEAVQTHLDAGLPDDAAQTAALAELGDARAAARRFGREYLTQKDVRHLGNFSKSKPGVSLSTVAQFVLLLLCWIALHNDNDKNYRLEGGLIHDGLILCVMAGAFAVVIVNIAAAWQKSPVVVARRNLSLRLILGIFAIAWFETLIWFTFPGSGWILILGAVGLVSVGIYGCFFLSRLRKKLLTAADDDLDPRDLGSA